MNLIQVQERLKDLPLQAIMAYANGANPDVEPFMALMEMQRRKRVEQQAQPAEAPTGTVKDQLEQQAGLAALQQMRMGQAQQQMMQGAAQQPMPVPEGAPQPEMQPEMSGIANAAAQPGGMQPGVMGMAGGGIVAFAKAGDVDEDEDEDDEDEEEAGAGYGGAETYAATPQSEIDIRDIERLPYTGEPPSAKDIQRLPHVTQDPYDKQATRTPPTGLVNHGPIQATAAPQGLQSIAQQLADRQAQAARQRAAVPQASEMPTRESMARENPAMYGVLAKPAGQGYLAGLEALMAKQAAEDPRAMEQLERNKRMDFYKALIAAGEGTRGQRGLGGLLGGFGKAAIPAMEARAQEEAGIRGQALKRDELLNKAKFEVEKLQRAQGEGDLKAVQRSKQELLKSAVELYKSGNASLAREIGALAGIREAEIRAAATEQAARTRAATKGQGAGAEKITDQERGVRRYYDAMIAEGASPGPVTMRNAQELYLRGKGVASLESTSARRDRDIADMLKTAEIMAFGELAKMSEAEKRTWRANKRKEIEADYEAGRYRLQRTPEAPTAPAPGAAPTTRYKFDAQGNLK
jgi:hypothetical protein